MDHDLTLELRGLSKVFDDTTRGKVVHVLDNIQYSIDQGRFVTITGPSGCGKTTLLRIIAGLEEATAGLVILKQKDGSDQAGGIGMVFQGYALFPWRTTLQNIQMGLDIMGVPQKEGRGMAMKYIRVFGLGGFEHRYPYELSDGMQQRVAIARTLIMKPSVVLMDEPFGSLDSHTRNELQEFLLNLWKTRGETIIFVTHNVGEAVFLSDQILVMSNRPGKIVESFDVDLPRPRDRTSPEYNLLKREVLRSLREHM